MSEEIKPWYYSKTIWTNLLVMVALILNGQFGISISGAEQVAILTVINIFLRTITKNEISWF